MANPTRRLFLALWPDRALQAAIHARAHAFAAATGAKGRAIPAERLHLTLLFLGNLDAPTEAAVAAAAATVRSPAFDLTLDQAGSFTRSQVLWIGTRQAPPGLLDLWRQLREALAPTGVAIEQRPLAPHVTCFRDLARPVRIAPIDPVPWPVRDFALVHSVLGAQAEYRVTMKWGLRLDRPG